MEDSEWSITSQNFPSVYFFIHPVVFNMGDVGEQSSVFTRSFDVTAQKLYKDWSVNKIDMNIVFSFRINFYAIHWKLKMEECYPLKID